MLTPRMGISLAVAVKRSLAYWALLSVVIHLFLVNVYFSIVRVTVTLPSGHTQSYRYAFYVLNSDLQSCI